MTKKAITVRLTEEEYNDLMMIKEMEAPHGSLGSFCSNILVKFIDENEWNVAKTEYLKKEEEK